MSHHALARFHTLGFLLGSSILAGLPGSLAAQEATSPQDGQTVASGAVVLDPLLITARDGSGGGQGDSIYRTPDAVSSMEAAEIQIRSGGNPQGALRMMPGVFTRQQSSQPGIEVNIRGLSGYGRVNAMIDGVPQTFRNIAGHEASGGSMLYVQPELLAGVDVARGAVAGAAGSGTLAGAANFRTLDIDDVVSEGQKQGVLTRLKFGGNGYHRSGMVAMGQRFDGLWGGMGEANYVVGTAYTVQGDYKGGHDSEIPGGQTGRASGNSPKGSLAKVEISPNAAHRFSIGWRDYDNTFRNSSYTWNVRNNTWTAGYTYDPGSRWINLDIEAYYNDSKLDYLNTTGSYAGRRTEDRTTGLNVTNRASVDWMGHPLDLQYGVSWSQNDFQTHYARGGNSPGKLDKASLFGEAALDLGRFGLNGGLRYDHWKIDGYRAPYAAGVGDCPAGGAACGDDWVTRDGGKLLPKIGLTFKAHEDLELYASYAHTFRPPTTHEAFFSLVPFGNGTGSGVANNLDLKPETSKTVEIGANFVRDGLFMPGDKARLKVGAFHSDIRNYIVNDFVYVPGRGTTAMWVNRSGTTGMDGIEIEGGYDLGFAYLNLAFTASNTDDQPHGDGAGSGNGEGSVLPDTVATLDIGTRLMDQRLSLGAQVRYVGEGKEAIGDYSGSGITSQWTTTDAYTLVDLYGSYAVTDRVEAFLSVENVEDKKYGYAGSGYGGYAAQTGRGRTFIVGMTARF
ncbi:TonB-dependent receptor [Sinirhodobacter populi]|uniref:TonB-dependent receptor n=1 Tax=Paenirhodobacter populi TaxID=2306993 RepID=A0A443KEG1_9RHOB|nr:TonB-dependent receptor [Sinirhodobacter populi]RWR31259.1 TonB-dependent receptor [Sinirhodobacter populi]